MSASAVELCHTCQIKTAEQRTINSNAVIGTLAVDAWAVTFGTASVKV